MAERSDCFGSFVATDEMCKGKPGQGDCPSAAECSIATQFSGGKAWAKLTAAERLAVEEKIAKSKAPAPRQRAVATDSPPAASTAGSAASMEADLTKQLENLAGGAGAPAAGAGAPAGTAGQAAPETAAPGRRGRKPGSGKKAEAAAAPNVQEAPPATDLPAAPELTPKEIVPKIDMTGIDLGQVQGIIANLIKLFELIKVIVGSDNKDVNIRASAEEKTQKRGAKKGGKRGRKAKK